MLESLLNEQVILIVGQLYLLHFFFCQRKLKIKYIFLATEKCSQNHFFFYLTDDNRALENDFFGKVDPSGSYLKNQPNNS